MHDQEGPSKSWEFFKVMIITAYWFIFCMHPVFHPSVPVSWLFFARTCSTTAWSASLDHTNVSSIRAGALPVFRSRGSILTPDPRREARGKHLCRHGRVRAAGGGHRNSRHRPGRRIRVHGPSAHPALSGGTTRADSVIWHASARRTPRREDGEGASRAAPPRTSPPSIVFASLDHASLLHARLRDRLRQSQPSLVPAIT